MCVCAPRFGGSQCLLFQRVHLYHPLTTSGLKCHFKCTPHGSMGNLVLGSEVTSLLRGCPPPRPRLAPASPLTLTMPTRFPAFSLSSDVCISSVGTLGKWTRPGHRSTACAFPLVPFPQSPCPIASLCGIRDQIGSSLEQGPARALCTAPCTRRVLSSSSSSLPKHDKTKGPVGGQRVAGRF